ncbi:hypothetical protein O181_079636 [Austropuccinia psidii MF-1]|uniref:CCHC-type domain-containing protein n=1 Tax=Austropuccinia psidii MF-1 TaxID=1389203 RepID=A0A9Q3IE55_9BASI|nr:hypothetical protein [Austropuccinia psidii MF-1]
MVITKGGNPTRQFRLLEMRENRIRENQATIQAIEEQLTQTGHTQIPSGSQGSGQISSPVASNHSATNRSVTKSHLFSQSQEVYRRRQVYKGKTITTFNQRKRESDPMIQKLLDLVKNKEPEVVVNNSRISSPINRNITPTQIGNNVFTPESNLNSDALWLQMSQYPEQTQKKFSELEARHERMKILTAYMNKIVKNLQEGHAQLSKASEETNKRLNLVLEEQHHSKRERDCLDQDIRKQFNVYHSMKPQPQGHVIDNTYHQDDIKPDAMLMNNKRSPSKYQDGDNMSYSEKEAFKQLSDASSWAKFSGTGGYDHMELIDSIDGLFIYLPSIPGYWSTARFNTAFKGHASIWYTEMKDIHGRINWPWWKSQIIQKYSNDPYEWCLRQSERLKAIDTQMNIQMRNHKLLTQKIGELEHVVKCRCNHNCTLNDISNTLQDVRKRTNIGKCTPYKSSGFKEKQPFRVKLKDKPRERVAELAKKKNSCHNCGLTDHYANNCPKAKKKVYSIEKVPEEESPTEDSDSDSMGHAIREQSDDEQDPREEFLVEYKEETPLEIQDIQLEAGMPQDTANKNLCKHTQDAQTFLFTPTKGMEYIHGTATRMTVCIDNAQHPYIIDSGAHCSILARDYLDNHFSNW